MKKIKIKFALYGFIFLVFLLLLLNWTLETIIHSRKEVAVPNLVGKNLYEALDLLEPLKLGMRKVAVEYDKNLPTGVVIRQNPAAGMIVREGKIVQITVSIGGESVFMPLLTGLNLRQAEIKIRASALTLGEINKAYSLKHPADYVIAQSPPSGSRILKGSVVNLTISAGAPPEGIVLLPDFVGQSVEFVMKWSEQTGITVEYSYEDNFKQVGRVLRQTPSYDTVLTSTHTVAVVVGK